MGDQKIETIQKIYEAFGTGDVPAILAVLTDEHDRPPEVGIEQLWRCDEEVSAERHHELAVIVADGVRRCPPGDRAGTERSTSAV